MPEVIDDKSRNTGRLDGFIVLLFQSEALNVPAFRGARKNPLGRCLATPHFQHGQHTGGAGYAAPGTFTLAVEYIDGAILNLIALQPVTLVWSESAFQQNSGYMQEQIS